MNDPNNISKDNSYEKYKVSTKEELETIFNNLDKRREDNSLDEEVIIEINSEVIKKYFEEED